MPLLSNRRSIEEAEIRIRLDRQHGDTAKRMESPLPECMADSKDRMFLA
jgi:hypothetical protein